MEMRSVRADLFMGQMEEQTEGQRKMMKLKANYRNFSNGVGACFPYIVRQPSNFNSRRKMMQVN